MASYCRCCFRLFTEMTMLIDNKMPNGLSLPVFGFKGHFSGSKRIVKKLQSFILMKYMHESSNHTLKKLVPIVINKLRTQLRAKSLFPELSKFRIIRKFRFTTFYIHRRGRTTKSLLAKQFHNLSLATTAAQWLNQT